MLNPKPFNRARHAAYVDALIDHTKANEHGARSAFIAHGDQFTEHDWPDYREVYEQRMDQLCASYSALEHLRRAGAL